MGRASYYANQEQRKQATREWHKAHPGYDKAWRCQNPAAAHAIAVKKNGKRRAVKKQAAVGTDRKATLTRIKAIKAPDLLPCHWCEALTTKDKRHVDHVIPLSKGGPHSAENLVCACQRCNCRKRNKLPHEFTPERVAV
jgi:5-methylcytosine-specific restriction endonuclease McrA